MSQETEQQPPKTKADVLKEWLKNSIANKQPSELDQSGRSKDKHELRQKFPDFEFSDSHYNILFKREVIRQKGKAALVEYGLNPDVVKTKKQKSVSSIGGTSQEVPKDVKTKTASNPAAAPPPQGQGGSGNAFVPKTAGGQPGQDNQQQVGEQIQQITMKFNERNVGAVIKAMYGGIKFFYPDLESLSDEEKQDLGDLFLPMFENHFQTHYATIIIPILAGASIIGPKVQKAKKLKAKKKEDSLDSLEAQKKKLEEKINKKKIAKERTNRK